MAVYKDDANLEALWLFENNLLDYTDNDNDLTDNNTVSYDGADYQEGSYSLDLERTDSEYGSITDGDQTGLDITGNISVCCWIKLESSLGSPIITKWVDSATNRSYRFQVDTDEHVRAWLRNSADTANGVCIGNSTLNTGTWYHVAFVYNGTDIRIYVDGSLDANGDNPETYSSGIYDSGSDVYVGRYSTDYYDGLIDELAVFSRELSAVEVADIYNNGIQEPISGSPWYAYAQQ